MATPLPFYIDENDPPAKREILRAALTLFAERGLAATSIRDIAEESGYTNPALYRHFAGKDELALHLFETCHARLWRICADALASQTGFTGRLDAYVAAWLGLFDDEPAVMAFLSDSARVLWPRASAGVRRDTMIGLDRALVDDAPRVRARSGAPLAAFAIELLYGDRLLVDLARWPRAAPLHRAGQPGQPVVPVGCDPGAGGDARRPAAPGGDADRRADRRDAGADGSAGAA